jgi:GDPmannose 4,6-dehydratase
VKRVLITGITGQDGSYLAEFLLKKGGYEIHGLVRRVALEDPEHRLWRIKHLLDKISLHAGSLESYASVFNVIEKVKLCQRLERKHQNVSFILLLQVRCLVK